MKKSTIAAGLALLASGLCHAGTYQAEITPGYSTGEIEIGNADFDTDAFTIGGEYYFNGVDDSKGPLAEAAFMDRASSIRAAYINGENDGRGSDTDFDGYTLGGRLVDEASGWLFSIDYDELDIDRGADIETWDFTVGKYVAENTTLSFTYSTSEEGNIDTDIYAVDVKHIAALSGGAYISLSGILGVGDVDRADDPLIYGGSFTYYPVRNIGVGASAVFTDSDDTDEQIYSLFGSWFPADNLAITASYEFLEDDDINTDADLFSIGAVFRF